MSEAMSPEQVAAHLTDTILFKIEQKKYVDLTRKEFLDTYAECIQTVRGARVVGHGEDTSS